MTLARATLAVGVAALAADSFAHATPVALLVALAAVALALDAADGGVARRTGTATALGARFDGEVDAFLILALSVYVAPAAARGCSRSALARYLFLAGEWLLPWMRAPLPPRRWRRVVAAAQGIVLTVAAADVLPRGAHAGAPGGRARRARGVGGRVQVVAVAPPGRAARPARAARAGLAVALTVLALVLVWAALVAPHQPSRFTLGAFARLPLELLVVVAVAVLLPAGAAPRAGRVAGAVLSVLVVVKVLDIGFFTAFDRPFKPVDDSSYAGIAIETLRDAVGSVERGPRRRRRGRARPRAARRPGAGAAARDARRGRPPRLGAAGGGGAGRGLGGAARRRRAGRLLERRRAGRRRGAGGARPGCRIARRWPARSPHDRFRATPGDRLLTGLRGKDVLLVFVESYGRVAVQDSSFSPRVDAVLDRGDAQLRAAGFSARSAFLTSPTFGGLAGSRTPPCSRGSGSTASGATTSSSGTTASPSRGRSSAAGWRAVGVMPANHRAWPEGSSFYRYDRIYDRRNLGYRGPDFGLPPMPDQYTLLALQRRELARRHRPPLFAEVDLISSHAPWTRIPRLIPWGDVGDGSVFDRVPAEESHAGLAVRRRRARARRLRALDRVLAAHARSRSCSATATTTSCSSSSATTSPRRSSPARAPSHDVPISVDRPRPEGAGPDRRLGLAGRDAAAPAGAGLADGGVPRPLPHRVRAAR